MEESQLHIVDLKSKDMLRKIENGIVYGLPVLLQDVLEELDPALEPVLAKALIKVGNRDCLLYTSPSPRDATLSRMPSSA